MTFSPRAGIQYLGIGWYFDLGMLLVIAGADASPES